MGREENRLKRVKAAQNRLVTREHMIDFVDREIRDSLAQYHAHFSPVLHWWQKREARWYRRLWRWVKALNIRRRKSA